MSGLQQRFHKHALDFRSVYGFHHDVASPEQRADRVSVLPFAAQRQTESGVQLPQLFRQSLDLGAAQMTGEKMLPIQIGRSHGIMIGKNQMPYSCPRKQHGAVGAKPARADDPDMRPRQPISLSTSQMRRERVVQTESAHALLPQA